MKLSKIKILILGVSGLLLIPSHVLAEPKSLPYSPAYVAFGDSITTGSSVATCQEHRKQSPWGCAELPTATPYPDRVARALHMSYGDVANNYAQQTFEMYRAGIWGYTIKEAAEAEKDGHNAVGDWVPQLTAIKQATKLVTGSLGINDMHFSDVARWAKLYIKPGDHVSREAKKLVAARSQDFDKLFDTLKVARSNGATVVLGLYYNPYQSDDPLCNPLSSIGDSVVNTLDEELLNRAHANGIDVADFRRSFTGHGAGSDDPYVFGTTCNLGVGAANWIQNLAIGKNAKRAVAIKFDPHPNSSGTNAMANAILQEVNNAD